MSQPCLVLQTVGLPHNQPNKRTCVAIKAPSKALLVAVGGPGITKGARAENCRAGKNGPPMLWRRVARPSVTQWHAVATVVAVVTAAVRPVLRVASGVEAHHHRALELDNR